MAGADQSPNALLMDRTAMALLFGATLAWSTAGLFDRAIPLDTPTVILWRGFFGASGLWVALFMLKGRAALADFTKIDAVGWFYVLVNGAGMLLFVGALKHTTIAHVAIIYATVPFAAAGLGWLVLREVPSVAAIIVIAHARPPSPAIAAGFPSAVWAPLVCLPLATFAGRTPGNVALMAGFGLVNSPLGFTLFV